MLQKDFIGVNAIFGLLWLYIGQSAISVNMADLGRVRLTAVCRSNCDDRARNDCPTAD